MGEPISPRALYEVLGICGGVLFFGRFYVQWWVSERLKRSVVPITFWYMSSCGSLMLLVYAILIQSPLGVLSHNFNTVVYARNLVHIWRESGKLTPTINRTLHAAVALVVLAGLTFVVIIWSGEYRTSQEISTSEARANWLWLAVGVLGQALFASRFLIQWLATERKKKSVVPTIFWRISIAAAILQAASFLQRQEWIFAIGIAATIVIYGRNLWLIHLDPARAETTSLTS